VIGCGRGKSRHEAANVSAVAPNDELAAHSAEFKREVIDVTEGVHVAALPGLAKFVIGRDIVETMTLPEYDWPVG